MKKLLLTIMVCCGLYAAQAQETTSTTSYTDSLVVTINGESLAPQETTILVTREKEGEINVTLSNFFLTYGVDTMYVGDIQVNHILLSAGNGYNSCSTEQVINIPAGHMEGVAEDKWIGPKMLGDVPIVLTGKLSDNKFYCTIDIDMTSTLEQMIYVTFGKDDFESSVRPARDGKQSGTTSVYTLQGMRVRSGVAKAHALDGLRKGVYVVDGKKVARE